ncbi:flavin reductase family protein [Micromonospora sp. WMMD882]|uniref:flavin reductase family protein n=1 Tax=Micromonospora sp. WMMD882 TaxID=3015151 RepID=UPI00248B702F|nr:flavin reductase family protein [Micromonospora sp. WMMD882]WBB80696.1 flavin reductase family protein [Micromonospora sp. WMMD882]
MNGDQQPIGDVTDPQQLRRIFGAFATGVTVVTVGGAEPHGMTANSFTTVSLDPPLVLISVDRRAIMHAALESTSHFGVSVLAADQELVARHFANRWRGLGRAQFDAVDWVPGRATGAPLIQGALARFECELWRSYDGGDHTLFLGLLLTAEQQNDDEPVLFLRGRFRQVDPERSEVRT